jgi:hypothetical protein
MVLEVKSIIGETIVSKKIFFREKIPTNFSKVVNWSSFELFGKKYQK